MSPVAACLATLLAASTQVDRRLWWNLYMEWSKWVRGPDDGREEVSSADMITLLLFSVNESEQVSKQMPFLRFAGGEGVRFWTLHGLSLRRLLLWLLCGRLYRCLVGCVSVAAAWCNGTATLVVVGKGAIMSSICIAGSSRVDAAVSQIWSWISGGRAAKRGNVFGDGILNAHR